MGPCFRPRVAGRLALALLAGAALAGCGRRGPLELPPGVPAAKVQPVLDTYKPDAATAKQQVFKEAPAPRPINAPPAARPNGFFLDPLL